MKDYDETLRYIHSLGMFSHPAGLERMTAVMNKLGNPQKSLYAVHIAGTNGKGSNACMTACALTAAGYKTGLFVSPYIIDFRERIQIDGQFIAREALMKLAQRVKDTGVALTEFEFITAVGFLYFYENACDICVVETGLGGRLDATNILPDTLPVITKIGLDHTAILGNTIGEIAAEKAAVIKDGIAVTCYGQESEALNKIKEKAPVLYISEKQALRVISCSILGNEFIYKGKRYKTALGGEHQLQNAALVLETLSALKFDVPYEAVCKGLAQAAFPARLEVISKEPLVVLDGAHNPDGGAALRDAMLPYSGEITAVVGMMRDKSVNDFLRLTLPLCKNVIAVRAAENGRALSAEEMRTAELGFTEKIETAADISEAVSKARALSDGAPVFVFGSLYLAAAARQELKGRFQASSPSQ